MHFSWRLIDGAVIMGYGVSPTRGGHGVLGMTGYKYNMMGSGSQHDG